MLRHNTANTKSIATWTPFSYKTVHISQQPEYQSQAELDISISKLKQLPNIVFPSEIERFKDLLIECGRGEKIFLQGGDCAERFVDCHDKAIMNKMRILYLMGSIISEATGKQVVKVGRLAGQYGKPRSSPFEIINGHKVVAFKGDNVNGMDIEEREPDPKRLVEGYYRSMATMNTIRASIKNKAINKDDLHKYLDEMENKKIYDIIKTDVYEKTKEKLSAYNGAFSLSGKHQIHDNDLFISHEGLLLNYEECFTRTQDQIERVDDKIIDPKQIYYNLTAHFFERTRSLHEAHVEYFRGIQNPIGIKVGPAVDYKEIVEVIKTLNPFNFYGKIVLITRMGHANTSSRLPLLVENIKSEGLNVLWVCDPMHGNTFVNTNKVKTRNCESVFEEIFEVMRILSEYEENLAGIHLELTGEHVTECIGGECGLDHEDLDKNYTSYCDPRLNFEQSLECAHKFAEEYKKLFK